MTNKFSQASLQYYQCRGGKNQLLPKTKVVVKFGVEFGQRMREETMQAIMPPEPMNNCKL